MRDTDRLPEDGQGDAETPVQGPPVGIRDWTQGSIARNLLRLSAPMIVSATLNLLGPTIDMIWIGKLGTAAVAGVGVAGIAVQLLMSAIMGLMMGMRSMVARFFGARDSGGANHVTMQAFVVGAGFAVVMSLIGVFLAETILGLFGLEEDVIAEGAAYLKILFVGAIVMSIRMMAEGSLQSAGDATTPMWIAVVFRVFHVALCPLLVFGVWMFPELGVRGAAVTNVLSQSLGLAMVMWVLFRGRSILMDTARWSQGVRDMRARYGPVAAAGYGLVTLRRMPRVAAGRLRLTLRGFRLDPRIIWRIVRIGIPASVMGMQMAVGGFVLVKAMSQFGTDALAAHTISQRVEMILFMPVLGLGMAAGILAGQNLGAGRPQRAARSGWMAAGLAVGIMLFSSVVLLLWGEGIIRVFNSEPDLVKVGASFLRIATAGYAMVGFMIVLQNCLSGVGDTFWAMVFSLITVWVVQVPLAFLMPGWTGLGVYGVRWAIVIAITVGALAYTIYFRTGRWKRKRV
jgi:Na+-driven multidrug efflux pump